MGIPLSTGASSGPPSIKLPEIGNSVTFVVVDVNPNVPAREYGTGNPKLDRFGRPKMQTVLTVLVTAVDGAKHGEPGAYTSVEAGSVASIFVESYTKYDPDQDRLGGTHLSFGGATDKLDGGLAVGDVGQWKYLGDLPSKAASPRKDRKFAFRKPKADEAAQVERCERLHLELKATPLVPAGGSGSSAGPFDEEEF